MIASLTLGLLLFHRGTGQGGHADPDPAPLSVSTQQDKSGELFQEIFALTLDGNKPVVLDRITGLYFRIIHECPDTPLAQESHWRLIESFFADYRPARTDEALALFEQFRRRYPTSPLNTAVKYTVARGLYMNQEWDELLAMQTEVVEAFFLTGKLNSPLPVFYYAEANFHLQALEKAEKGYRALIDQYPDSRVARMATTKMGQIRHGRE